MFVLERADTMNDEAANSLLKTLEEPPAYVVLLLLTDRPSQVLPTIASRCQGVRFDPLGAEAVAQRLQSQGVAPDAAPACARLSLGDGEKALALGARRRPRAARRRRGVRPRAAGRPRRASAPWRPLLETARERGRAAREEQSSPRSPRSSPTCPRRSTSGARPSSASGPGAPTGAPPPARSTRRSSSSASGTATSPASPPGRPSSSTTATASSAGEDAPGATAARCARRSSWSTTPAPGSRSTSARSWPWRRSPTGWRDARAMTEVHVRGARTRPSARTGFEDEVAVEEPLEIRVDGAPLAVTMRTPGHDEELALGFLHGEGLIDGPRAGRAAGRPRGQHRRGRRPAAARARRRARFYTTSSCGVCGKGALEEVAVHARRCAAARRRRARCSPPCPSACASRRFARTGGLHATGPVLAGGRAAVRARGRRPPQRDGQGRRLGAARGSRAAAPARAVRLAAGSRSSSSRRPRWPGAPLLVGVGAPTSLAVELADDRGHDPVRVRPRRAA